MHSLKSLRAKLEDTPKQPLQQKRDYDVNKLHVLYYFKVFFFRFYLIKHLFNDSSRIFINILLSTIFSQYK